MYLQQLNKMGITDDGINAKYGKMINEFALFASGFQGLEKQDALNFLNLNFH